MKGSYKLQRHNKISKWLFLVIIVLLSACQSKKEILKDSLSLQEAKATYNNVSELQGYPTKNLLRSDWQSWKDSLQEGHFAYPVVPYFPYFVYNACLVHAKEIILLPGSVVTGGSEFQDEMDGWVTENSLKYRELYNQIWRDVQHANFINMDKEILQDFSTGVVD